MTAATAEGNARSVVLVGGRYKEINSVLTFDRF